MEGVQKVVGETKAKPPASTWRADAPGVFFTLLLAIWAVQVAVQIKEGNSRLWQVFAAFAFFEVVNQSLSLFLRWRPEITAGLTPEVAANFVNVSVSLVHSYIISLLVIGLMVKEAQISGLTNMLSHDVLFNRTWPGAYTASAMSCGYFAYDQWDTLRKHLYSVKAPYRLVHHAVLIICFTPVLQRDTGTNYLILSLICKIDSIFMLLRKVKKLLPKTKSKSSSGSFINWTLNWMAYLLTRLFCHMWLTAKLVWDASKFPFRFEWSFALTGMVALNFFNVMMGQGLYRALMRERSSLKRRE